MSEYRCLAADGVVMHGDGIVLLERSVEPYRGYWVLPGGMVEMDETAREACRREVKEEVDLEVEVMDFVGLYDDLGRDSRGNVSAAYVCRSVGDQEPRALEEAGDVGVYPPDDLPRMGFDHSEIVRDSLEVIDEEGVP